MKIFKVFLLLLITVLIVWIDLPENYKIGKFSINPLSLDFTVFGIKVKKEFKTHLGLDLKGGSHLVFQTNTIKVNPTDLKDALSSARNIIEKRVNFFGVSEPTVQTLKSGNNYRISIDLPGIEKVDEAIALIGRTAQLSFQEEKIIDEKVASPAPVLVETGLTGKHIKKASVDFNQQDGKPQVALSFNNEGARLFGDITKRNIGKPLAIVVDNFLISAPTVQQAISEGNAVITGNFTVDEAKKLTIAINSGALPLPIKLIEQKNIGPTLGTVEVKKSVIAGFFGLAMVLLFMILYYGKLGIIASMALLIYGLISLAIFRLIPVVLTLPGIAGFILSIGMAVDANILIFERIKEEIRKGKEFEVAVRLGFGRAIDAIKDANITTLTVAFILFNPLNWEFLPQFGMVKGFALTLAIGVAISLFTGVVITKRLIDVFYKKND
ncbi:protein translocase subunit SecD [Candidatus Roizmanbacteria bacterium CG_4_10_14_0_8_um_filter_35_28]|uniref:Protein translocase subunit SecD n=5 Tax=Candidatus Roizmaniibacteriota TaxID=1752723 RepID=A0A2M8F1K8_9BACT|nr:MAG: protein translocase subunit SecD [Candidatus Roizmanbacteria bacterium CG23_combo_of_CG06-09_8_20_14_all_35_49]PIY71291.1 MAG: protein translocase subunit SecD [Candidatus Roizmanbacteria bacterium CG_4_10_14_0_8_um_filter_35_28]PJC33157.1 MAG: protein translocase subunit SecD [Candidatus Roizmanbacteria bacterium CG_4_9_14_0_2_um_filter_35_15]